MLRSDLENHPLWTVLDALEADLEPIAREAVTSEVAPATRIRAYVAHIRSMRELAGQNAFLVSNAMLASVQTPVEQVRNHLANRLSFGPGSNYVENAAVAIEDTLMPLSSWPRPYAQGGQVKQMRTLFEDLLEQQRLGIEQIEQAHQKILASAESSRQFLSQRKDEIIDEIEALRDDANAIKNVIESQKVRIDEVVQAGLAEIDQLRKVNNERFDKLEDELGTRIMTDFLPHQVRITELLGETKTAIENFREQHRQFENMSSAAASETMAGKFMREARWGRVIGVLLYLLGFGAIVAAAIPFVTLLSDVNLDTGGDIEWGRIVIRAALGVLLGSAATVVIRLGARFLSQASAAKRMELELRTFEPFLANVKKRESVDQARLEIVDRSFGRAYETPAGSKDGKDETVDLSVLERITNLFNKLPPHN